MDYYVLRKNDQYFTGKMKTRKGVKYPDVTSKPIKAKMYVNRKVAMNRSEKIWLLTGIAFEVVKEEVHVKCS